jgi:hypothetical protein
MSSTAIGPASGLGTDLMIGDFFMITCPYLYELKTLTTFPYCATTIPSSPSPASARPRSFCWTSTA